MTNLEPKEAARRFAVDPDSVCISFPEIMRAFGITWPEMLKDLQSGVLVAHGDIARGRDYYVTGSNLAIWLATTGRTFVTRQ